MPLKEDIPATPPPDEASGFSRRGFLKGVGGVLGASALAPAILRAAETAAATPASRAGIRMIPAAGQAISLKINGQARDLTITPNTSLLEAVREHLDLTGSKQVC